MKSFIPWIGGKSQLCKTIKAHFPKEIPGRYIEVLGGAGWLLFSEDRHAPMEVFNDIDGHLINLYRCIKYHCGELQRQLRDEDEQWLPTSRQLFEDALRQLDMPGLTDIQRATRYFYIIRASFGANRRNFCCSNMAGTTLNAVNQLPEIHSRIKSLLIENRDFEQLLKTYDRKDALVYLDPPYYKAEKYYDGFTMEDHKRLFQALLSLKGRFILSYNDHPDIRQRYMDYNLYPVMRCNSLANKMGKGQEQYAEPIITNY